MKGAARYLSSRFIPLSRKPASERALLRLRVTPYATSRLTLIHIVFHIGATKVGQALFTASRKGAGA